MSRLEAQQWTARVRSIGAEMVGRRVAVIADLVADEYLVCRTDRISREAPAALILCYEDREMRLGGGANAVANLRALGAEVMPVGVVGADDAGAELLARLQDLKVDVSGIVVDAGYRTVVKSRVLTSYHHSVRQQVLRIDREDRVDAESASATRLRDEILARLDGADAFLVSDYGYGAATPKLVGDILGDLRRRGVPSTLDSRYRMLSYRGARAATPNEPEAEDALGITIGDDLDALAQAGAELRARMDVASLLITRGSAGMALFDGDREMELLPVFGSDQVADVTGAGDTVIATLTLALAAGATFAEAAALANVAGGIVVGKTGTATVTTHELVAALQGDD